MIQYIHQVTLGNVPATGATPGDIYFEAVDAAATEFNLHQARADGTVVPLQTGLTAAEAVELSKVGVISPNAGVSIPAGAVVLGPDNIQYQNTSSAAAAMPATFPNASFQEYSASAANTVTKPSVGDIVTSGSIVIGEDNRQYENTSGSGLAYPASFPAAGFDEYAPPLSADQLLQLGKTKVQSPNVGDDVLDQQIVVGPDARQWRNTSGATVVMPAAFPTAGFIEYSPSVILETIADLLTYTGSSEILYIDGVRYYSDLTTGHLPAEADSENTFVTSGGLLYTREDAVLEMGVYNRVSATRAEFYSPKSNGLYMQLIFERYTQAATTDASNPANLDALGLANYDAWATIGHNTVRRDGSSFTLVKQGTVEGLNEFVVRENGAGDFSGANAHGNETLTLFEIKLDDGAALGNDIASTPFTKATFRQVSEVWRHGNDDATRFAGTTKIMDVDWTITVEAGDYTLECTPTAALALNLDFLYAANYTHDFNDYVSFTVDGDATTYYPANLQNSNVDPDTVFLTGATIVKLRDARGYGTDIECTPTIAANFARITRLGDKNKFYASLRGRGSTNSQTMAAGESVTLTTKYTTVIPEVELTTLHSEVSVQARFHRPGNGNGRIDFITSTFPAGFDRSVLLAPGTRFTWETESVYSSDASAETANFNGSYEISTETGTAGRYNLIRANLDAGQQTEIDKLQAGWTSASTPYQTGTLRIGDGLDGISAQDVSIDIDPGLQTETPAEIVLRDGKLVAQPANNGRTFTRTSSIQLIRNSGGNLQFRLTGYEAGFAVNTDFSTNDKFEIIQGDVTDNGETVNLDGSYVASAVSVFGPDDVRLTVTRSTLSVAQQAEVDKINNFTTPGFGPQVAGNVAGFTEPPLSTIVQGSNIVDEVEFNELTATPATTDQKIYLTASAGLQYEERKFLFTENIRTITDDTVGTFPLSHVNHSYVAISNQSGSGPRGLFWVRASGTISADINPAGVDIATGVLTGTTGTDGNWTLSVDTTGADDVLQVENRSGATSQVIMTVLTQI